MSMTTLTLLVTEELQQRAAAGHQRATTADAGGQASLLLFTLGPVQDFIAAARRTSDLRAGSYLLSSLAASALHEVVARQGKDAVYFPDLSSEPELLRAWESGGKLPPDLALPNRFLAIVPAGQAASIARVCEQAARDALAAAVSTAKEAFETYRGTWGWHEAAHFLECTWAALPYAAGSDYHEAYQTLEQAVGGAKALRLFAGVDSTGFRDSLVPTLGALVPHRDASQKEVDTLWKKQQDRGRLRLRAGEQLSAITLTKRLFAEHAGRHAHDLFPSTASFAVADFKRAVLEKVGADADLRSALEHYQMALTPISDRREVRYAGEPALPLLARLATASGAGEVARWLAALPGDWLFDDFLTPVSFEREFDLKVSDDALKQAREALRALLRVSTAAHIARPSRYYGLIVFDGDRMGKWLSGEKTGGISEAGHLAISAALGVFARHLVPHLVEKQFLGRLVYSGGDDVLAFVSFDDALPLMQALRAAFSGHLSGSDETGYAVDWTQTSGSVRVAGQQRQTLGPEASASAGLVLAHQQEPLQEVLDTGRSAEKAAKNAGRDRFTLALGRRSGGRFTAVGTWRAGSGTELLPTVTHLAKAIQTGALSSSFLYDAQDALDVLSVLPEDAVRLDLRRLFGRRTERVKAQAGASAEQAIEALWQSTLAPLLGATPTPADALHLVHAAVIFGKGGDRDK